MDAWFLFTFNVTMKISFPVIDFSCSIGKRKEERVTVETSKYLSLESKILLKNWVLLSITLFP